MDWKIPLIILQLIFLEGLLSIDNAAVLGAMVASLPNSEAIPWPGALRRLGHRLDRVLGHQRMAALRVGLLGAYVGRGAMLVLASLVVRNPWLKIIGAAYLVRLAFDNLGQSDPGEGNEHVRAVNQNTFWSVVLTVELADLIFSLDNVVAAVSLSDQLWVVMLGVAIGILMMRFAAGWFSYAVEREPVLKTAAYILILNIGIELLISEISGVEINDYLRFGVSVATILLCLAYAHLKGLHWLQPALNWVAQGFARTNDWVDWALFPVIALIKWVFRLLARLFPHHPPKTKHEERMKHVDAR